MRVNKAPAPGILSSWVHRVCSVPPTGRSADVCEVSPPRLHPAAVRRHCTWDIPRFQVPRGRTGVPQPPRCCASAVGAVSHSRLQNSMSPDASQHLPCKQSFESYTLLCQAFLHQALLPGGILHASEMEAPRQVWWVKLRPISSAPGTG